MLASPSENFRMKARDTARGLTAETLRTLLDYNPANGKFFRKISNNQWHAGSEAAQKPTQFGYTRIMVQGKHYMAHRLAWLHFYGEWPAGVLDHRNLNKTDNRIENLRIADSVKNVANIGVKKTNFLGIKGVRLHECGKYTARIGFQRRVIYLGVFDTPEEASAAYAAKAAELYGEFARVA